jgi:Fe-S cluster assembly scaffold protein SufB
MNPELAWMVAIFWIGRKPSGLSAEDATALVVNGFVKDVLQHLPMEFAVEAQKLISISLEGSVG